MNGRPNPVVLGLGVVGWAGLVWLGVTMFTATPRTAGFDLELVLQAGRDVAAGVSPYDPAMVAGSAPGATDLFYSYPPPVAQFFSLFAAVPSGVMLAALWLGSVAGLACAAVLVARRFAPQLPASAVVFPAVAVMPLFLPYSVALLFGNLDALFPLAYGLVLVSAVAHFGAQEQRPFAAGGIALSLATVAKVAPGALGGWFAGRWLRATVDRGATGGGRAALAVIGWAALATAIVLGLSLLAGGLQLWREYVVVAGSASAAELLDPRNAGPAAQIAMAVGGGEQLVRTLQIPISIAAVVATLASGALVRDRLLGVAFTAVATLVILPITWYHYPVALIPFGIAAVARSAGTPVARRTEILVIAAIVIASLSIAWLPGLYLAVALFLAGVALSAPAAGLTAERNVKGPGPTPQ